ncbi:MAG: DUF2288 domain-containing protein [Xenococcaceae cyanobacterium]
MSNLKAQLREELAEAEWSSLIPHAQRSGLIVVSPSLDLIDVGVAIAGDNVALVQHWISEQLIYKPSSDDLSTWNTQPDKKFSTLIVQPFVLVSSDRAVTH